MNTTAVRPVELSHLDDRVEAISYKNRSTTMSNERSKRAVLDVRRGTPRAKNIWLSPAIVEPHDSALPSAGAWVERNPNTYAREKTAIPVTVGWSAFRIL